MLRLDSFVFALLMMVAGLSRVWDLVVGGRSREPRVWSSYGSSGETGPRASQRALNPRSLQRVSGGGGGNA